MGLYRGQSAETAGTFMVDELQRVGRRHESLDPRETIAIFFC